MLLALERALDHSLYESKASHPASGTEASQHGVRLEHFSNESQQGLLLERRSNTQPRTATGSLYYLRRASELMGFEQIQRAFLLFKQLL